MCNRDDIFITIFVASYNYGRYLRANLESIMYQTYSNFEVIVLDDGSTDNSLDIINEFVEKDSRFKLVTHENHQNLGLTKSLKKAIDMANGQYMAFCESDDYWNLNHLEEKVKYIKKHPDADIVACYFIPFGKNKELVDHYIKPKGLQSYYKVMKGLTKHPKMVYFDIQGPVWVFPTFSIVMAKTNKLRECNINPPTKNGVDIWLWRQMLIKGKTGYVDQKLTNYRRAGEQLIEIDFVQKDYNSQLNEVLKEDVKRAPWSFSKIKFKIKKKINKIKNRWREKHERSITR